MTALSPKNLFLADLMRSGGASALVMMKIASRPQSTPKSPGGALRNSKPPNTMNKPKSNDRGQARSFGKASDTCIQKGAMRKNNVVTDCSGKQQRVLQRSLKAKNTMYVNEYTQEELEEELETLRDTSCEKFYNKVRQILGNFFATSSSEVVENNLNAQVLSTVVSFLIPGVGASLSKGILILDKQIKLKMLKKINEFGVTAGEFEKFGSLIALLLTRAYYHSRIFMEEREGEKVAAAIINYIVQHGGRKDDHSTIEDMFCYVWKARHHFVSLAFEDYTCIVRPRVHCTIESELLKLVLHVRQTVIQACKRFTERTARPQNITWHWRNTKAAATHLTKAASASPICPQILLVLLMHFVRTDATGREADLDKILFNYIFNEDHYSNGAGLLIDEYSQIQTSVNPTKNSVKMVYVKSSVILALSSIIRTHFMMNAEEFSRMIKEAPSTVTLPGAQSNMINEAARNGRLVILRGNSCHVSTIVEEKKIIMHDDNVVDDGQNPDEVAEEL